MAHAFTVAYLLRADKKLDFCATEFSFEPKNRIWFHLWYFPLTFKIDFGTFPVYLNRDDFDRLTYQSKKISYQIIDPRCLAKTKLQLMSKSLDHLSFKDKRYAR